jgi:nucleoside-diphosphate-sugar epimerase
MKLLVTGASGFLGSCVVSVALERGHQVKAVVRPQTNLAQLAWSNHPAIEIITLDLAKDYEGIVTALDQVEAVIHLAAAKTGDYTTQYQGTVVTTENLLQAMNQKNVNRLIAISTFSVYDYLKIPTGVTIDENSPLEENPQTRDIYAQTKLSQESKYREFAQKSGGKVTIIRPGMIYGKDYLWNACLGNRVSDQFWLRIGNNSIMPLIYVENCATAIILAAETDTAIGETINLVDDDLPTQKVYVQKLQKVLSNNPKSLVIPLPIVLAIANFSWFINQKLLQGKAKIPGILIPSRLNARFKSLKYSNQKAKQVLNWQPRYSLEEALQKINNN